MMIYSTYTWDLVRYEIDEKIYKEPKLETAIEIEKQLMINEEKFIKTELDGNKVDLETSKKVKIKKNEDVFDEVKREEPLKDIEKIFIDNNDILDHDEISESDQKFIINLINRTDFITDTKKFIKDTEVAKMGQKRKKDSITADKKR